MSNDIEVQRQLLADGYKEGFFTLEQFEGALTKFAGLLVSAAVATPEKKPIQQDDTRRLDFITTFGEPWMVQWEKRGSKPIRYRMLEDAEPYGKWHATARQAIDAAMLGKATK